MTTEIRQKETTSWTETPPSSPPLRHAIGSLVENQAWLDKIADPLQNGVKQLFSSPRFVGFKKYLNGVWLGHPVHPTVTDVPIGSWTATLVLDCAWLSSEQPEMARAADMTLLLGLLGAGAAAVTGLTDWSDTDATDRRVGLLHGLLNGGATMMNLTSYVLRRAGKRRAGIALSGLTYLATLFSAYLGGELSLAKGIGVNHVAWEAGPEEFVAVMDATDLPEKKLTRVEADGMPVVLWREDSKIYALAATCSHLGGPLDEGTCQDGLVTCPWHGSSFRLADGSVAQSPAVYAQPTFAVRIQSGKIELRRLAHA